MTRIVFDIGGTNLRMAVAGGHGLGRPLLVPIAKSYRAALVQFAAAARKLAGASRIEGVAGGLPGPMDAQKSMLIQSTHLPRWVNRPFVHDLRARLRAPVWLENDSALVALGEATKGAGRGRRIVAYIGIGTGIGGARIVDGRIDRNAWGFEPGHHIVDWNVTRHAHPSPHPGDWESFVSGSAARLQTGRRSDQIFDRRFWRQLDRRVAIGLINAAVFWSPDTLVIGGSLIKRLSIIGIRRAFNRRMKIFPTPPTITRAQLGSFGGLYGAAELIRQRRDT